MADKIYKERTGGSYVRDEDGKVRKVEGPDVPPAPAKERETSAPTPVNQKKGK